MSNDTGTGITQEERRLILEEHNRLRQTVAMGYVHGQPAAANMQEMRWDDELAVKAQQWANQCTFQHDPSRYLSKLREKALCVHCIVFDIFPEGEWKKGDRSVCVYCKWPPATSDVNVNSHWTGREKTVLMSRWLHSIVCQMEFMCVILSNLPFVGSSVVSRWTHNTSWIIIFLDDGTTMLRKKIADNLWNVQHCYCNLFNMLSSCASMHCMVENNNYCFKGFNKIFQIIALVSDIASLYVVDDMSNSICNSPINIWIFIKSNVGWVGCRGVDWVESRLSCFNLISLVIHDVIFFCCRRSCIQNITNKIREILIESNI